MTMKRSMVRRNRPRSRTRIVFYVILAIILGVIAWSLSTQLIDRAVLIQIYVAASVLAVGVVIIDMLGLLGEHHGDADGSDSMADDSSDFGFDGHSDSGADSDGDGSFGHADFGDTSNHGATEVDSIGGDDAMGSMGDDTSHLDDGDSHDISLGQGPVLEAIRYLRMFVYFCLGFGLVGLAALFSGRTPLNSLVFASVAGIATVMLARLFYRFQPKDTGAVLSDQELVLEQGLVIIPLSDEYMGKIRVSLGMEVREVYAKAAHTGERYERGAKVRVVSLGHDCVYVEGV